jgi:hypothetical protein
MDRVKNWVAALELQRSVVGNKQDMRFVAAGPLVQELATFGQIHRLPFGDVFEENDRVGNAAIIADDQALEIPLLLRLRIARLC